MIRKSTWLALCLCGLLVLLFGCSKKQENVKPAEETKTPPVTKTTNSNPAPPPPSGNGEIPPPPAGNDTMTTTDTSAGPPQNTEKPMTARQAMDRKAREGASMDEINVLEVPK